MNIFPHLLNRSLSHVIRFSSTPQHFHESVAEHSFFCAYIVSILCRLLQQKDIDVQREKAITMALIHDVEEVFSGDILGPFKHSSQEVADAIRKVNKEVIHQAFANLPGDIAKDYIALWNEEGEGESIEAQLVKTADRLSLLAKCAEEVRVGNEFFREMYNGQLKTLQDYDKPWWLTIKHEVIP